MTTQSFIWLSYLLFGFDLVPKILYNPLLIVMILLCKIVVGETHARWASGYTLNLAVP